MFVPLLLGLGCHSHAARSVLDSYVHVPMFRVSLQRHGLGDSALGSVEHGDRVPDWLVKWTALVSPWVAGPALPCLPDPEYDASLLLCHIW